MSTVLALWLALAPVRGPDPTLLVEIQLVGVGATTAECLFFESDSTLLVPSADVAALLGIPRGPTVWLSLAGLRAAYPSVVFTWLPHELRLVIQDDAGVLPATQHAQEKRLRVGQGAPPVFVTRSGPFAAVTADDRNRQLVEAGYSYRGRVAVSGTHSSTRGTTWALSVAPSPVLFATVSGQHVIHGPSVTSASARLALGPLWLASTWTPATSTTRNLVSVDGLAAVGPLTLFGSSRNVYAVTLRSPLAVQIGHSGTGRNAVTTARVSVGPVFPNPFVAPTIP